MRWIPRNYPLLKRHPPYGLRLLDFYLIGIFMANGSDFEAMSEVISAAVGEYKKINTEAFRMRIYRMKKTFDCATLPELREFVQLKNKHAAWGLPQTLTELRKYDKRRANNGK